MTLLVLILAVLGVMGSACVMAILLLRGAQAFADAQARDARRVQRLD